MKRKPLLFALALLAVISAALWGVNYRLDHPPLSEADKQFRALVAGADSVQASQMSCQTGNCYGNVRIKYKSLDATQTRELIETLRFTTENRRTPFNALVPGVGASPEVTLNLAFQRQGKTLLACTLMQTSRQSALFYIASSTQRYSRLQPRSNKRLNRALDAYLPQRIRP